MVASPGEAQTRQIAFEDVKATTAGDAVVYVPDQKLLITGDILVWPVPYATTS